MKALELVELCLIFLAVFAVVIGGPLWLAVGIKALLS